MPVAPSTQSSTSVRLVALGVVSSIVLLIAGALFAGTANAEPGSRLVWVCKYVGSPADPRFQGVISTNSNATDGEWFTDAQLPSKVIREVQEGENRGQAPDELASECPQTPPGPTTPPVTETTPPVTETTPPVTETTPPVTETTPPVTETTPPVTTTTDAPTPPEAAPTDLGSSTTTGIFSLFAIALSLLGAAAYVLRGARH